MPDDKILSEIAGMLPSHLAKVTDEELEVEKSKSCNGAWAFDFLSCNPNAKKLWDSYSVINGQVKKTDYDDYFAALVGFGQESIERFKSKLLPILSARHQKELQDAVKQAKKEVWDEAAQSTAEAIDAQVKMERERIKNLLREGYLEKHWPNCDAQLSHWEAIWKVLRGEQPGGK